MNDVARIPATMTVEEFQHWRPPADLRDRRWQLFDGEPRCIAPASQDHGAIRHEAAFLLNRNLSASQASWRVVTAPSGIRTSAPTSTNVSPTSALPAPRRPKRT